MINLSTGLRIIGGFLGFLAMLPFTISLGVFLILTGSAGTSTYGENLEGFGLSSVERLIIRYRGALVIAFVLPGSWLYNYVWVLLLNNGLEEEGHTARVKEVQRQVQNWVSGGKSKKLVTARPGWQRMSSKFSDFKSQFCKIDLSSLANVVAINKSECTVEVEPFVTVYQLTNLLLPQGFALPVVPELDELTIGGLVAGTGIETSSHIYGLFQNIVLSVEILSEDGEIIRLSRSENPEYFATYFWSMGTLGFLMKATLRIQPAKPFVRLKYLRYDSRESFLQDFVKESQAGVDLCGNHDVYPIEGSHKGVHRFVEGLLYSENLGILILGDYCDPSPTAKISHLTSFNSPWFYERCLTNLKEAHSFEEITPTEEFFHRHTRSLFWEIDSICPLLRNPTVRYLTGWALPLSVALLKLSEPRSLSAKLREQHIAQDMLVPAEVLGGCLDIFHEHVHIYPVWLCPFRLSRFFTSEGEIKGIVCPREKPHELFVDVGVYGNLKSGEALPKMRLIEKFVREKAGFEMLYADCFMNRKEFCEMFNLQSYDKLSKSRSAFPHFFDKVVEPDMQRRLQGLE